MRNKPRIRFKGFTEDWEQCKLSEVVTINPKTELPDEFKYVDLESVVGTNLLGFQVIKKENAPSRAQRLASYGDVFYQTVRPYQRNNYLFENIDKDMVFSTGYAQLRSKLDSYFLLTLVQNDNFVKVVLDNCTGTSYPAINGSELGKITVQIPSNEVEANQIGKVFRGIDKSITLHQRKLEKLKLAKKALLQKLFPKNGSKFPELRFKGFADAWEQCKLSEVVTINPKTELPDEFKYVDLESVVGTNLLGFQVIKKENAPSRAQRLASYGDVFYQTVRPYQRNNYLFENIDKDMVFSTGYAQLRSKLDSYFLLTLVQNDNFVKVVLDNCTGTSYPAINGSELGKITVQIPSNEVEANQIGKVFRGIDKSITLHQRKLDKLQEVKKGLLQKMFV